MTRLLEWVKFVFISQDGDIALTNTCKLIKEQTLIVQKARGAKQASMG